MPTFPQGLDQFTSAEDIKNFFDAHITAGVTEDAVFAGTEILKIADKWCKSGCTDKSAKFLQSIFSHMNGGSCSTADEFCGECADRAASWFSNRKNKLPCCVESVIQKGIKVRLFRFICQSQSSYLFLLHTKVSSCRQLKNPR